MLLATTAISGGMRSRATTPHSARTSPAEAEQLEPSRGGARQLGDAMVQDGKRPSTEAHQHTVGLGVEQVGRQEGGDLEVLRLAKGRSS